MNPSFDGLLLGFGAGIIAATFVFCCGVIYGSQRNAVALMIQVLQEEAEEVMTANPPLGIEP